MSEKTMIDIAGLRAKLEVGSVPPWDAIDNYLYSTQLASASKDDVPPSVGMTQRNEDASLIASLVNAIPALLDAYEAQAERIAALESEHIKHGGIIHDCHEFIRSRNLWLVFCEWLHRRPTGDA